VPTDWVWDAIVEVADRLGDWVGSLACCCFETVPCYFLVGLIVSIAAAIGDYEKDLRDSVPSASVSLGPGSPAYQYLYLCMSHHDSPC
jgi:hypothetical protein